MASSNGNAATTSAIAMSAASMDGGDEASTRTKRTRGPRSCLECRQSKQRCEQLNFAAIVPSAEPQPAHMACRRCRVLQLSCVVQDQLPKSTRLRIERSKSNGGGEPPPSLPPAPLSATSSRPSFGEEGAQATATYQRPATYSHPTLSPRSSTSISPFHVNPNATPNFSPAVFDPLPVLQGAGGTAKTSASPSAPSVLQPAAAAAAATSTTSSPHSHFSGGSNNNGGEAHDPTWFYRARIACRPTQLLEHLLVSAHAGPVETWWPRIYSQPSSHSLEQVVLHLAGDAALLSRVVERMMVMQMSTFPYHPDAQTVLDDVEQSAFLLGVVMHLEGGMEEATGRLLHDRLAERCAQLVERQTTPTSPLPPPNMYDVCALLIISNMCPLLLRSPSLVGAVAGNATLLCALRAANAAGFADAPSRLVAAMDNGGALPYIDSAEVQRMMLWVYMYLQLSMVELFDEPMPSTTRPSLVPSTRPYPPPPPSQDRHPQNSTSAQSLRKATRADAEVMERYCRAVVAVQANEASDEDEEWEEARSPTALRCASMLLIVFAAQQTAAVAETLQTFTTQFDDQVCQVADAAARMLSLRKWTDQVIDTLAMQMANARQALHELAAYLGARRVVSTEQLKYFELSLGALEFTSMCRMKDKLYVIGVKQLGPCKTSHEFLFGIFARPQMLKSYEHLGLARSCVAKHVLTLWSNLALDVGEINDGAAWRALGCVFPLARWSGMFVTCVTVLVEELAGRFMAQESPWGAQGESRLETYLLVVRQTFDALTQLQRDAIVRFGSEDHEQVRPVSVALDALAKTLQALRTWRKKASGIGQYGKARMATQQRQLPQHHTAPPPPPPNLTSASMPPPPNHTAPLYIEQVPFGDALLHDILYMPIEQFFAEAK